MSCNSKANPGIQRPGKVIRVPFVYTITAGAVDEIQKVAPPGDQKWKLLDIVADYSSDDVTLGTAPVVFLQSIKDGSQGTYFPKIGDRSDPDDEVGDGANVRISLGLLQNRLKGAVGMGQNQSPLVTWDLPECTSSSPVQIGWTNTNGAGDETVSGYLEFQVISDG